MQQAAVGGLLGQALEELAHMGGAGGFCAEDSTPLHCLQVPC